MIYNKKYNMSRKEANETLQNVFSACNKEPNSTNFDILILKSIAQTNLVSVCKWIARGFIFLVLIAPVALINNDFKVDAKGIAHDKIIIEDHQLYKDCFILVVRGDDINYDSIYARNTEGEVIFPLTIDPASGTIEFPYGHESLTIYIPNNSGQVLVATLSEYSSEEIYVEEPKNEE